MTEIVKYAVEFRKGTKWNQNPEQDYRYMECKLCGQMEMSSAEISTTCHDCVREMTDPPEISVRGNTGKVSGWHFMKEFVDKNGNVYHKGIEQPQLKGKLKPTVVEKKNKLSKKEKEVYKQEAAVKVSMLKKELKGLRWKKDKKLVTQQIKNYSKIMKGKFTDTLVTKLFS
tara:strand:+ start:2597 stop:3109 length:513 start_codon:yes stop_codon:yes gene_type:complete